MSANHTANHTEHPGNTGAPGAQAPMRLHLARAGFEAARCIASLGPTHRLGRLHGHSFKVSARCRQNGGGPTLTGVDWAQRVAQLVEPLDYSELNARFDVPSDVAIGRGCLEQLGPATEGVRLASTLDGGVEWRGGQWYAWRGFGFEAAHRLPNVPSGHPCGRMHGHSFRVIVHVALADDDELDAGRRRLDAAWQRHGAPLAGRCLNAIAGLENPTSELIAAWLWQRLDRELGGLAWVSVFETDTAGCHYDGRGFDIWKAQSFEAANAHGAVGVDPSGHSYRVRLHVRGDLDTVLGWVMDYGDIKARFRPLYDRLDHHRLDALAGLGSAGPLEIAAWIHGHAGAGLTGLTGIDVMQGRRDGGVLIIGPGAGPIL